MHAFLTKEFRLEYFLSSITVLKKPKMANEGKRMQKKKKSLHYGCKANDHTELLTPI